MVYDSEMPKDEGYTASGESGKNDGEMDVQCYAEE